MFTYDQAPLLYFINYKDKGKGLFNLDQHRNSIVEYFDELNMEKFSEIVKSKKNADKKVFYVYLGNAGFQKHDLSSPTIPCKHDSEVNHQIEQVRRNVNNISLFNKTKPKIIDGSEVRLIDTDGNEIVPGKKYFLKMRQEEEL